MMISLPSCPRHVLHQGDETEDDNDDNEDGEGNDARELQWQIFLKKTMMTTRMKKMVVVTTISARHDEVFDFISSNDAFFY